MMMMMMTLYEERLAPQLSSYALPTWWGVLQLVLFCPGLERGEVPLVVFLSVVEAEELVSGSL